MTYVKNKYELAKSFIGKTFNGGKLEVINIHAEDKWGRILYEVRCSCCSPDIELFPNPFIISKNSLEKGTIPCGCSKRPAWDEQQFLVKAKRVGDIRGFKVHGFAEKYKGSETKIICECRKGHKWTPIVNSVLRGISSCRACKYERQTERLRIPEDKALSNCTSICMDMNYKPVGFPNGYKNQKSRFEYICPVHGIQSPSYYGFVKQGARCKYCFKEKQKELSGFYGYYPHRVKEQDYLYVMNFNDKYIKVGRSFNIQKRLEKLPRESGIYNIEVLRIYTATHQEVWDLEQSTHDKLTEMGFYHFESTWSIETFNIECLDNLNMLLNSCDYERLL